MSESGLLTGRCASCGAELRVKSRLTEKVVSCPKCKSAVPLSRAGDSLRDPEGGVSSEYAFPCPSCSSKIQVPRQSIGKVITCRECDDQIRVPGPSKKPDARETKLATSWTIGKFVGIGICFLGVLLAGAGLQLGSTEADAVRQLESLHGEPRGKVTLDGNQVFESVAVLNIDGMVFQKADYVAENSAPIKRVITTPTKRIEAIWEDGMWKERVVKDDWVEFRVALYVGAGLALLLGLALVFLAPSPGNVSH